MMKPRHAQRDGKFPAASRTPAGLAGSAVLAAAAALILAAAPAATSAQAAAGTGTARIGSINCPPPHPEVRVAASVSDC